MLRPVPDVDVAIRGPRGDDVGVLWLVPRFVDFAGVDNLLHDVESD